MQIALTEARLAPAHGDVPIGAIAVKGKKLLARAHNERELRNDPCAHAEVLVLQRTAELIGSWRLTGVTIFSTLEPCPMCAGALVAARIKRLVFGAPDERAGAAGTLYNVPEDPRLNHNCSVTAEVLAQDSIDLLQSFFRGKRRPHPTF